MMRQERTKRRHFHLNRSWYGQAARERGVVDKVTFGLYYADGGTEGELAVRWLAVGDETLPQLVAFSDSWEVLASLADVVIALGKLEGTAPSAETFCALLDRHGFEDATRTTQPRTKCRALRTQRRRFS